MTDPSYRCSAASLLRDEPVAGTASTVRAFLLVEHAGPWGVDALRDARLPDGLGAELGARAREAGVRVLLVRRPGRRAGGAGQAGPATVLAAYAHPHRPWLERGEVADLREVLDLDLAALRAGDSAGITRHDGTVLCVCTHGRHDACCAERGRPVAAALAAAHPEETWEVSHIGGDRFAGNMLVLPHGLYYGRLEKPAALAAAGALSSGQLELDHLRGRSGWAMPVQYAEIALRRELGETRADALRLVARKAEDGVTDAVFAVGAQQYAVRVRTTRGPDTAQLTCRAERENPLPCHELLGIRRA
ncbi:sucrase ferredoxin [Nocardioides sp. GCM10027113]|uniref:sucrase ferredoxin n=1 Tax=unclassified Nocardioides TaxID=2615069 RepID=UPI003610D430